MKNHFIRFSVNTSKSATSEACSSFFESYLSIGKLSEVESQTIFKSMDGEIELQSKSEASPAVKELSINLSEWTKNKGDTAGYVTLKIAVDTDGGTLPESLFECVNLETLVFTVFHNVQKVSKCHNLLTFSFQLFPLQFPI